MNPNNLGHLDEKTKRRVNIIAARKRGKRDAAIASIVEAVNKGELSPNMTREEINAEFHKRVRDPQIISRANVKRVQENKRREAAEKLPNTPENAA